MFLCITILFFIVTVWLYIIILIVELLCAFWKE
nr:MAG TPA: hypothetical protein [Caudoviricetes sp.]